MEEICELIVNFHEYCGKCKHFLKKESSYPCRECLSYPTNTNTSKPLKYEEK